MKRVVLMLLCIVMGVQVMKAKGETAFVAYFSETKTLKFIYGNRADYQGRITCGLNDINYFFPYPGWTTKGSNVYVAPDVEKVVFDPSFQYVRPNTMCDWFYDMSNLTSIEGLQYLNTSCVEKMSGLFCNCYSLTYLDLRTFDTSNVRSMEGMFSKCLRLKGVDLSSFNTSNVENMKLMFYNCCELQSVDVRNFNTQKVKDFDRMFLYCNLLTELDLSSFDTRSAEKMKLMFARDICLRKISVGSGWNTANVTESENMFYGCEHLSGGLGTTYDEEHTDISYAHIDGGSTNPGYLTDGASRETYVVYNNGTLTFYRDKMKSSRQGTKYTLNTDMQKPEWYDDGTYAYVTNVVIDSSFADVHPKTTFFWFNSMSNLTSISGLEYLRTDNVRTMRAMFGGCSSLTKLDLSRFNTSLTTDMGYMFSDCTSLNEVKMTYFNTESVTEMSYMFSNCTSLQDIRLVGFNTPNLRFTIGMFQNCISLVNVSVAEGWNMDNVENSIIMFQNCLNLVGGAGTTYDATHTDGAYAHIDAGTSNPGYFTYMEPAGYDLIIGGVRVNEVNCNNIPVQDGTAVFRPEGPSLILDNCTITGNGTYNDASTGYGAGIYSNISGLVVCVYGNVTVTGAPSDPNSNGIFFNDKTTIYGNSSDATLTATGFNGIYSDTLSINVIDTDARITIVADGSEGGLVAKRDRRTRPQLTYYYTRPLALYSSNITLRCRGGAISGISYWEEIGGHPDLQITSPKNAQWHPEKHMITDTDGNANGNPIVGDWIVIEAPVSTYDLWIAGTQVSKDNKSDLAGIIAELSDDAMERYFEGEMEITYDESSQTLTLQNAIIHASEDYGIQSNIPDLKIRLIGDNVIISDNTIGVGINEGPVTFLGGGSLDIKAGGMGFWTCSDVFLTNGVNITAESLHETASGFQGWSNSLSTLTMSGSETILRAKGGSNGSVTSFHALNLSDDLVLGDPVGATFVPDIGVVKNGSVVANEWVTIASQDFIDGIKEVKDSKRFNDNIYNLVGQRLSKPQKGINIIGGKKVLVK